MGTLFSPSLIILVILVPLHFHINLKIGLCISAGNHGILIGIVLNLFIYFLNLLLRKPPTPHLTPPSPSHPSGLSQCTSSEHPVSCIKPGLVICFTYDNIHVSMLFSQIIPPLLSPTESKRLLNLKISLREFPGGPVSGT